MGDKNRLEEILKKAQGDPEARPEFYQTLMNSAVYVVGRPEVDENGQNAGHFQLKQWKQPDGTLSLPFFATLESLEATLGKEDQHLHLPVPDLFRLTAGVTLVLTCPGVTKAFKPDEVTALLATAMAMDPLAQSLMRAVRANNEEARKEFYRVLVNSQIFVVGEPSNMDLQPGPQTHSFNEDTQFNFASCDHPYQKGQKILPFFSSVEHLRRVKPQDNKYISFNALTFFNLTRGVNIPLILNIGSQPHKIFNPDEIDFLLRSAVREPFEARHFKPGTKVFLGAPTIYPQELVGAMLDFLPRFPEVRAAYVTTIREGSEDSEPVLVFGFEAEGDLTPMFRAAGIAIKDFAQKGQVIDFARIEEGESGLSQYFLEKVKPFYLRAKNRQEGPKIAALAEENAISDPEVTQEQYDKPGFFGRLKRMLGTTEN